MLELINDILARFSQQKYQKFSARFARTSTRAPLYHSCHAWPAEHTSQIFQ